MAHIHEKIDFTASVLIVFENKVLIRKHEKYGIWLTPGGHVELDEDPNQAVIREAKEETGLDITLIAPAQYEVFEDHDSRDLVPPFFVNRHKVNPVHEHIDNIFVATTNDDTLNPAPEEQQDGLEWVDKDAVLNHPELGKHMKRLCLFALDFVDK